MAGKKANKSNETMYNAVALQYIKYIGERIAPGTEFIAKESDIEELKKKECAEIKEVIENKNANVSDGTGEEGEGA